GESVGAVGGRDLDGVGEAAFAAASGFFHDQSACGGCLRCVYKIHFFVEDTVQQTDEHGAPDYVRTEFGRLSRVANADAAEAGRGRRLRHESSEAFAQFEVRTQETVLFGGERGHIYGVANQAFGEVVANLLRDQRADFF